MVPAVATAGFPATWPTDGREGGVPDPATAGPAWIQIGTEGGFLPAPVVIPNQPINWNMNATAFNVGNVTGPLAAAGLRRAGRRHRRLLRLRRPDAHPLQRRPGGVPGARPALRLLHRQPGPDRTRAARPRPSPATAPTPAPSCRSGSPATAGRRLSAWQRPEERPSPRRRPSAASSRSRRTRSSCPQAGLQLAPTTARFPARSRTCASSTRLQDLHTHRPATPVTIPFEPKAIHDEMGAAYDTEYGRMSGILGLELPVGTAA